MRSKPYFCNRSNRIGSKLAVAFGCWAATMAECLTTSLLGQELPPIVMTQFEIEADSFSSNFKPQVRTQCEEAISAEMARLGEDYFGCFQWMPLVGSAKATNSAATLKLKLLQQDRGYNFEISLGYFRLVGGRSNPLGSLAPKVLYPATKIDQPTQDATQLQLDILAELRQQFDNQSLRNRLQEEFLSLIPITKTLEMATNVERVIIPIPWDLLRATDKSILLVKFQTHPPTASPLPVTIKMSPKERNLPSPWPANVGCLVIEFDRPPVASREKWHPMIPESYAQRVEGTAEVYMLEYWKDYSVGTTGTLADRP